MASRRLQFMMGIGLLACLLALGAVQAQAFTSSDEARVFEVPLREAAPILAPEQFAPAVEASADMTARYGGTWQVYLWNPLSDSPELMYGSGVDLASAPLVTDREAEAVATGFVGSNLDVLRADAGDLVTDEVVRAAGKVAVHFVQRFHGIPVAGGRVLSVFTESGRLFVFGSTFYRDIHVNPVPAIGAAEAAGIARADLPFNPATDSVLGEPELLVLPVPGAEGGVEYHLVWRTVVGTSDPYGAWVTHVDAHDGRIVWRFNDVHYAYSGTVRGDVDQSGYCQGQQPSPFQGMTVNVTGAGSAVTDSTGSFNVAGSGGDRAINCQFNGPMFNVNDTQFGDSNFNGTIQEDVPLAIYWNDASPSRRAERDCMYWLNETYAFVKKVDPAFTIPAHQANVNVNSTCNANWSPYTMNFFREGGGCANTGVIGDVMAHEYGHGLQNQLLGSQGSEGLGEGNGDIAGSLMTLDSVIGRGFYLNNCTSGIRDCENTLRYPGDVVGQPIHNAGRVICGFNWDTWQALQLTMGPAVARTYVGELWHYSRKLIRPTNQPAQVLAYFVTDDDDGNLANGTPHHSEICEGATNHGFSCPEILVGVIITHTPLGSTADHVNPRAVIADIYSTEAAIDIARLYYRISGGPFTQVDMTQVAAANYTANIPAQAQDEYVEYYIYAHDASGNERTSPANAPVNLHQFLVYSTFDALEVPTPWTVGAPGDNATTGVWVRVDPNGTPAQPEDDHTPAPGVLCFVTGQGTQGGSIGENDVDGGTTTLLSPVFDLSQATQLCMLEYWRWYSNNGGATPNTDFWVVDVSNDGGATWVSVENVNPPNNLQNIWLQVTVDIIALFGTPNQVQLRFKASDLGSGSIVEAAVDDLAIAARGAAAAVDEPAASGPAVTFKVGPNEPNPFNPETTIRYSLAARSEVAVTIFDVAGREVRNLVRGLEDSGEHAVRWDGLDDAGQPMSSGIYYYRVEASGLEATRKMVLLK